MDLVRVFVVIHPVPWLMCAVVVLMILITSVGVRRARRVRQSKQMTHEAPHRASTK
jgi:hypothetical protein